MKPKMLKQRLARLRINIQYCERYTQDTNQGLDKPAADLIAAAKYLNAAEGLVLAFDQSLRKQVSRCFRRPHAPGICTMTEAELERTKTHH